MPRKRFDFSSKALPQLDRPRAMPGGLDALTAEPSWLILGHSLGI